MGPLKGERVMLGGLWKSLQMRHRIRQLGSLGAIHLRRRGRGLLSLVICRRPMYSTWGGRGQNMGKNCQRLKWMTSILKSACKGGHLKTT